MLQALNDPYLHYTLGLGKPEQGDQIVHVVFCQIPCQITSITYYKQYCQNTAEILPHLFPTIYFNNGPNNNCVT